VTTAPAIALLALAASAAELPPALVVHAPQDAVLSTQDGYRLAAALVARMPALRLVVEGEVDPDDLLVTILPADQGWTLTVRRADKLVLERTLPAESSPDAAFFVACAAVIERFLEEIDWKGKPEAIDPNAVARPKPPPPPPPWVWSLSAGAAGSVGYRPYRAPANPTLPTFPTWGLRVGPAIEVAMRKAALWTAVRVHLYGPNDQVLHATWPIVQDIHVKDLPLAVTGLVGGCSGDTISLCGGAQLGWRGTWAWVANGADLFGSQSAHSDCFLGGLFGIVSFKLPLELEIRAMVNALGAVGDKELTSQVTDPQGYIVNQQVALSPRFEVGLTLELARQIP
jgi:hypothetical protein